MSANESINDAFTLVEQKRVKATKRLQIDDNINISIDNNTIDGNPESSPRIITKVRVEYRTVTGTQFPSHDEARAIMTLLKQADPTIAVISMVKSHQKISRVEDIPHNKKYFEDFFKMESYFKPNNKSGQTHVIFKLESLKTLQDMKNDSSDLISNLKERGAFLKAHVFATNRIVPAGFIILKHHAFTNKLEYDTKVTNIIKAAVKERKEIGSLKREQISNDIFIETTTKSIVNGNKADDGSINGKITTLALEVKSDKNNKELVIDILAKIKWDINTYGTFVPYDMVNTNNRQFNKCLSQHNRYINNLRMLPVSGLHEEVLDATIDTPTACAINKNRITIRELMMGPFPDTENGGLVYPIIAIEKTSKTIELGKWSILTTIEHFELTRSILENLLQTACSDTPEYKNHLSNTINFSNGISTTKVVRSDAYNNYVNSLGDDFVSDDNSSETHRSIKSVNRRRRKQIIYKYTPSVFPPMNQSTPVKTSPRKTSKAWQGTETTRRSVCSNNTVVSNSTKVSNNTRVSTTSAASAAESSVTLQSCFPSDISKQISNLEHMLLQQGQLFELKFTKQREDFEKRLEAQQLETIATSRRHEKYEEYQQSVTTQMQQQLTSTNNSIQGLTNAITSLMHNVKYIRLEEEITFDIKDLTPSMTTKNDGIMTRQNNHDTNKDNLQNCSTYNLMHQSNESEEFEDSINTKNVEKEDEKLDKNNNVPIVEDISHINTTIVTSNRTKDLMDEDVESKSSKRKLSTVTNKIIEESANKAPAIEIDSEDDEPNESDAVNETPNNDYNIKTAAELHNKIESLSESFMNTSIDDNNNDKSELFPNLNNMSDIEDSDDNDNNTNTNNTIKTGEHHIEDGPLCR